MNAARLLAILEMDETSFLSSVNKSKKSVDGFDATMSKAKVGLSQTSRAMSGLSIAAGEAGGKMGRLGGAVTSLISAFVTNPIYAVIAACTMFVGFISTKYEKAMDSALEKTKALAKAESDLGDSIRKRLGLSEKPQETAKKESEKAAEDGRGGNLYKIKSLRDQRNKDVEEAKKAMQNWEALANRLGERGSVFYSRRSELREAYTTAVEVARVTDEVYQKAVKERQEKSRKQMTASIGAQMEDEERADKEKTDEAKAKAKEKEEREKKLAKEKEERIKKEAKILADGQKAIDDARSGKSVDLKDWEMNDITKQGGTLSSDRGRTISERNLSRVGTDSMTRFYSSVNPNVRAIDRQLQISEKILEEQRKTIRAIEALGEE